MVHSLERVLFDHLPKCAGTSVQILLKHIYGADRVAPFISSYSVSACLRLYTRFDAVCGHFSGRILMDTPFDLRVFTMVRDPVERLLSAFYYQSGLELSLGGGETAADMLREVSLDEFIRSRKVLAGSIPNWFCIHFADAIGQLTRHDHLLARAVEALDYYDLVGLAEEPDTSAARIAELCGGAAAVLLHENASRKRPMREQVDASTVALIEDCNRLDIEFYKRAVDRFHSPRRTKPRASLPSELDATREFGTREINFENVRAQSRLSTTHMAAAGDVLEIDFALNAAVSEPSLSIVIVLKNQFGDFVFGWDSHIAGERISIEAGERRDLKFEIPLNVGFGQYFVVLMSYSSPRFAEKIYYHHIEPAAMIDVQSTVGGHFFGAVKLDARLTRTDL